MSAFEITRFIADSIAAARHLTPIEHWLAAAELGLALCALTALRALARPVEPVREVDYEEAA
jgi:hypothetical protein